MHGSNAEIASSEVVPSNVIGNAVIERQLEDEGQSKAEPVSPKIKEITTQTVVSFNITNLIKNSN